MRAWKGQYLLFYQLCLCSWWQISNWKKLTDIYCFQVESRNKRRESKKLESLRCFENWCLWRSLLFSSSLFLRKRQTFQCRSDQNYFSWLLPFCFIHRTSWRHRGLSRGLLTTRPWRQFLRSNLGRISTNKRGLKTVWPLTRFTIFLQSVWTLKIGQTQCPVMHTLNKHRKNNMRIFMVLTTAYMPFNYSREETEAISDS